MALQCNTPNSKQIIAETFIIIRLSFEYDLNIAKNTQIVII